MEKDQDQRIEELARKKLEGKSYSDIRAELSKTGMSTEDIKHLLRQVDERVLNDAVSEATPNKAQQWYRGGMILAVVGLALSIAFNAGLILRNLPPLAIYAPFIAGILLMFYGRYLQRRPPAEEKKGLGPIRKKRPYK